MCTINMWIHFPLRVLMGNRFFFSKRDFFSFRVSALNWFLLKTVKELLFFPLGSNTCKWRNSFTVTDSHPSTFNLYLRFRSVTLSDDTLVWCRKLSDKIGTWKRMDWVVMVLKYSYNNGLLQMLSSKWYYKFNNE